jgi:hypothetical protein
VEENKFQNIPSKRLYDFLNQKVINREVTLQEIAETFDVYKKNPSSYFHALRTGITSVKLDHILKAQEHFGLNPCDLFDKSVSATVVDSEKSIPALNDSDLRGYFDVLKSHVDIIKDQQRTIYLLVDRGNSKGGSM